MSIESTKKYLAYYCLALKNTNTTRSLSSATVEVDCCVRQYISQNHVYEIMVSYCRPDFDMLSIIVTGQAYHYTDERSYQVALLDKIQHFLHLSYEIICREEGYDKEVTSQPESIATGRNIEI